MTGRPAFILPVVLVLVGLLAVTMAGFMFFVRSELAGIQAQRDAQQARLAAESGLEEVITVLRASPNDPTAWFDLPERFRHALVWAESYDRSEDPVRKMGSRKEILASSNPPAAWRYSVVAQNLDGLPQTMRFGVTPEAGKLNLNAASESEITALLTPLLLELQVENASELIAGLLDWLDEDQTPRPGGGENEYYNNLEPGYNAKNGPLDTLEEILLVKGWTAAMLYGEDTNRNGLLDANEDDGAGSFPYYDNADGILNHGIAPYVTVWSREPRVTTQSGTEGSRSGPQQPAGQEEGLEEGGKTERQQSMQPGPGGPSGQPTGSKGRTQVVEGLVNINAAPLRVLMALDDMPEDVAQRIVALRSELDGETLTEPDWPVKAGAMDEATYQNLADRITTRALQFHVEIVGYGDHTKLARRYEWIIEMRGSLAQVLYHRDLTALGFAWPVDDDTVIIRSH